MKITMFESDLSGSFYEKNYLACVFNIPLSRIRLQ